MTTDFNIETVKGFTGITSQQNALLVEMKPMLEKHADTLVQAFYNNLDQLDATKKLLDADPGRRDRLKGHLRAWLVGLANGKLDSQYQEQRYAIGKKHVEIHLDPRWVVAAMSFCRAQIRPMIEAEYGNAADKLDRYLALDLAMDIDLNIMLQSYDDRRMDLFLETTGFSKALFESMISSGT